MQMWQQGLAQMTSFWAGALNPAADRATAASPPTPGGRTAVRHNAARATSSSQAMRARSTAAPLDERSKAQWGFALRQVSMR